ncbi:hypothetical protein AKO1_006368 [Acrasis kona]|uniref:Uncharacterized protein n=1 Tax=Acrasis kona TaxID=1008807 RepID=A0AAW2YJ42_9EUKA
MIQDNVDEQIEIAQNMLKKAKEMQKQQEELRSQYRYHITNIQTAIQNLDKEHATTQPDTPYNLPKFLFQSASINVPAPPQPSIYQPFTSPPQEVITVGDDHFGDNRYNRQLPSFNQMIHSQTHVIQPQLYHQEQHNQVHNNQHEVPDVNQPPHQRISESPIPNKPGTPVPIQQTPYGLRLFYEKRPTTNKVSGQKRTVSDLLNDDDL